MQESLNAGEFEDVDHGIPYRMSFDSGQVRLDTTLYMQIRLFYIENYLNQI